LLLIISGRGADCCSDAEYFGEIDRVLNTVIPRHDETALGIEDVLPIPLCGLDFCASRIHLFEMIQVGAHDLIVVARNARAHYIFLLVVTEFLVRSIRNTLDGTMTMRSP
jgi:hypothetical protein